MTGRITCHNLPVILDWENDLHDVLEHAWPEMHWPHRGENPWANLLHSMTGDERDGVLTPPYPCEPVPRINELVIPSGASRYGKALLLMDAESAGSVLSQAWGANDLNAAGSSAVSSEQTKNAPVTVSFSDGTNDFDWEMFLLQPQAVDGAGELWLVPLVDVRFFWNRHPRSPPTFTEGTESDWDDVWNQILAAAPFLDSGTKDTIDSRFLTPDREIFAAEGLSIGAMIDAFAMSVGMRAVHSQNASGDLILNFQNASTAVAARNSSASAASAQLMIGGFSPPSPLPADLIAVARKSVNHFRRCGQDVRTESIDDEVASETNALIHLAFWSFFNSTGVALDEDSSSKNQFDGLMASLAETIAEWGDIDTFSASYSGVVEWSPGGLDDYVSFSAGRDGGLRTFVKGLPSSFRPSINLCQGTAYYLHEDEDGKVWRILGDIPAANGFVMDGGSAIPMKIDQTTGVLTDDKRTNGSSITEIVWNAAPSGIVAWDGTSTLVQTKRVNCLPVIDVEYCPPEEVA